MDNNDNNVEKIREYFKKNKAKNYPINNHFLNHFDEDIKELYICILCNIITYKNVPKEEQKMHLERIIAGTDILGDVDEHIIRASSITPEDFEDFVESFLDSEVKYIFFVDAIILISFCDFKVDEQVELLTEIMEIMKMSREEVKYLTAISKSILEQSFDLYSKALNFKPSSINNYIFICYTSQFVLNLIVGDENGNAYLEEFNIEKEYYEKDNLVFENINFFNEDISLDAIEFNSIKNIKFINCKLNNRVYQLKFINCGEVNFINCSFFETQNEIIYLDFTNEINFLDCKFNDCGYFIVWNNSTLKTASFFKCRFYNCGNNSQEAILYVGDVKNICIESCQFNEINCKKIFDTNYETITLKENIVTGNKPMFILDKTLDQIDSVKI